MEHSESVVYLAHLLYTYSNWVVSQFWAPLLYSLSSSITIYKHPKKWQKMKIKHNNRHPYKSQKHQYIWYLFVSFSQWDNKYHMGVGLVRMQCYINLVQNSMQLSIVHYIGYLSHSLGLHWHSCLANHLIKYRN